METLDIVLSFVFGLLCVGGVIYFALHDDTFSIGKAFVFCLCWTTITFLGTKLSQWFILGYWWE